MKTFLPAVLLAAFALAGCQREAGLRPDLITAGPASLAELAVPVGVVAEDDTLTQRAAFFADGEGGFFYDALAQQPWDPAMGYVVGGVRVLDGWRLWASSDSTWLGPGERAAAVARPDFFVRQYIERDTLGFTDRLLGSLRGRELAELTEQVSVVPGALVVDFPDETGTVQFAPTFSDRRERSEYAVADSAGTLLIARANRTSADPDDPRPVWLAFKGTNSVPVTERLQADLDSARTRAHAPARLAVETPGRVVVATGQTQAEAVANAERAFRTADAALERRRERMAEVLEDSYVRTEDRAYDRALAWARLTLDGLLVRDSARAYFAEGIPGALPEPGITASRLTYALLASGQWETARDMITTFGGDQVFDRRVEVFGRAPDGYDPEGDPVYRTADATPRFVALVGDYVRATGDTGLINPRYWQNTVYATRGTFETSYQDGLIRAPAEATWMQALDGRGAPYADRGPFPAEAQGALYRQLQAMQDFAGIMGVSSQRQTYADSASLVARRVAESFVRSDSTLLDNLRPGQPTDTRARPNAFLALQDLDLDPAVERAAVRRLVETLVYPWGVSTLSQRDSSFRPALEATAFYEPASALYKGAVWTWLTGPVVALLTQYGATGQAYELTQSQAERLIERGVIGALPELVDPHPRRSADGDLVEPLGGGAPVQPWSLAEFVTNAYRDYAGITYTSVREVVLEPHLPESWGETDVRFRVGDGHVVATLEQRGDRLDVTLAPEGALPEGARVRLRAFGLEKAVPLGRSQGDTLTVPAEPFEVRLEAGRDEAFVDGEAAPLDRRVRHFTADYWDDFAFAEPDLQAEYPIMRRVEQDRQLTTDQVLQEAMGARVILTRTDPDGDDWGANSNYVYPERFPEGLLDLSYVEISEDEDRNYFRIEVGHLIPPDSLGYPPLMFALAFDTEEGGTERIERGADYDLPEDDGYDYIIWIGDGILVEDARGRELGSLEGNAGEIENVAEAAIQFSLPKNILPDLPEGSVVTLVVGARTPGGGLGGFQPVRTIAGPDEGGGKDDPTLPNVFDVIITTIVD